MIRYVSETTDQERWIKRLFLLKSPDCIFILIDSFQL